MSDRPNGDLIQQERINLSLTPVDHGIAAMERQLLAMGVPIRLLAQVLLNHSASIVSLIDPPEIRAQVMKELIGNYARMVETARTAAATTRGGIILPKVAADVLADQP